MHAISLVDQQDGFNGKNAMSLHGDMYWSCKGRQKSITLSL